MQPKKRVPTHPGEVLLEEFLGPLGVTQVAFAEHIGVSVQRVNEVVESILKLSRQDSPHPKPLVLAEWLETQIEAIQKIREELPDCQVYIY